MTHESDDARLVDRLGRARHAAQFQPLDPASPTTKMELRLPQGLLDRVDEAARAAGVNRSVFVRDALAAALDT